MRFEVHLDGVDNGLVERLTAAADRKLAPKLRRLAARQARRVHSAATHHAAISHPHPARHATAHHTAARRSPSHPAVGSHLAAAALGGLFTAAHVRAAPPAPPGDPSATDSAPDIQPFDASIDHSADTVSDGASSADGGTLFDVSLDTEFQ